MTDFSYMDADDQAEAEATERVLEQLHAEHPDISLDVLLDRAIEQARYDLGMTSLEVCIACDALYNRDYGGEYIDPFGDAELAEELGVTEQHLLKLQGNHYCDVQCLRSTLHDLEVPA